jgi:hypothetical protein
MQRRSTKRESKKSNITDWHTLVRQLEQRWDAPTTEVLDQLIVTMRYAVFSTLDLVRSASSLLRENAKSFQAQSWAEESYQKCQSWAEGYWKLQERCLGASGDRESACKCILQGIGPLLVSHKDILSQGSRILDLEEGKTAKVATVLFEKLSDVAYIYAELQSQDLSWLLKYIDDEDRLRQARAS